MGLGIGKLQAFKGQEKHIGLDCHAKRRIRTRYSAYRNPLFIGSNGNEQSPYQIKHIYRTSGSGDNLGSPFIKLRLNK